MSLLSYNKANKQVYEKIKSRLVAIGINIEKFIEKAPKSFNQNLHDIEVYDTTLDGIKFMTADSKKLERAFYKANDLSGNNAFASLKSTNNNWALKCSFSETPGTGWREIWRPMPYKYVLEQIKLPKHQNPMLGMRLVSTTTSIPFDFTSLHCSLSGNTCKIHIDKNGFVVSVPNGVALTFDLYQHTINELLFKSDFRDWLVGKMPNSMLETLVKVIIDRVSVIYPNSDIGFAGLKGKLNLLRIPNSPLGGLKNLVKIAAPIGVSADLYNGDKTKVQGHVSWLNGEKIYNITIGRDF